MTSRLDNPQYLVENLRLPPQLLVRAAQGEAPGGSQLSTRFAPSPNGRLHLGHALAAIFAHDMARRTGARFLLRIEDIDGVRSRPEHVAGIVADMDWLGLTPDAPPIFQSAHIARHEAAVRELAERGLAYRCFCSRAQIADVLKVTPVRHGPDGPVYPGTCAHIPETEARERAAAGEAHGWRLRMERAVMETGPLEWTDLSAGTLAADPALFGDIVVQRRDAPSSYHLAATLDDAAEGIGLVVRGQDLFAYSAIHRLLQALFALPVPLWWHHPLLLDESGGKLAKRKGSPALADRRAGGEDGRALADRLRRGDFPDGLTLSPLAIAPSSE